MQEAGAPYADAESVCSKSKSAAAAISTKCRTAENKETSEKQNFLVFSHLFRSVRPEQSGFPVTVLHGCNMIHFLENSVKMLYILVTYGLRNALHCRSASFQHRPCLLHTDLL